MALLVMFIFGKLQFPNLKPVILKVNEKNNQLQVNKPAIKSFVVHSKLTNIFNGILHNKKCHPILYT